MENKKNENKKIEKITFDLLRNESKKANESKKWFTFGISIPINDENDEKIDLYKKLIDDVKRKLNIDENAKNIDVITKTLLFVIDN